MYVCVRVCVCVCACVRACVLEGVSDESFLISSLLSHTHTHQSPSGNEMSHVTISKIWEGEGSRLGWQEQLLCFYNLFLFNASMDSAQRHACHQKMWCNISSVNNEHTQDVGNRYVAFLPHRTNLAQCPSTLPFHSTPLTPNPFIPDISSRLHSMWLRVEC